MALSLKKFIDNPAAINFIASFNVLFNVFIGAVCLYVSDRVWTRFGRRKPFLVGGWIPLTIAMFLVPMAPNIYVLVPIIIVWLACQDISSTIEPLQQEVTPPHQRGRAGAMFNIIVQLVVVFTWVIVVGRFNELQYIGSRIFSGEQGAYWLCGLFLIASIFLISFFFKEQPVKNSLAGEKITPVRFFKGVFGNKELWPVYLLVFAQAFMRTQAGAIMTLLFVEQWDYSPQQMGTNIFVGAMMTIVISIITGYFADKIDRIKLYIFGLTGSFIMQIAYYVFVQFMLPDHRPNMIQIILFGQLVTVFGMMAGVVGQPLMYDYIPRDKMGTAAAGISYVRSLTRWLTLNGVGIWVVVYSKFFCEKGEYDYFSSYLYSLLLTCVGMAIILNFQRLVKKGVLIPYGRMGIEEVDATKTEEEPAS